MPDTKRGPFQRNPLVSTVTEDPKSCTYSIYNVVYEMQEVLKESAKLKKIFLTVTLLFLQRVKVRSSQTTPVAGRYAITDDEFISHFLLHFKSF